MWKEKMLYAISNMFSLKQWYDEQFEMSLTSLKV